MESHRFLAAMVPGPSCGRVSSGIMAGGTETVNPGTEPGNVRHSLPIGRCRTTV